MPQAAQVSQAQRSASIPQARNWITVTATQPLQIPRAAFASRELKMALIDPDIPRQASLRFPIPVASSRRLRSPVQASRYGWK